MKVTMNFALMVMRWDGMRFFQDFSQRDFEGW